MGRLGFLLLAVVFEKNGFLSKWQFFSKVVPICTGACCLSWSDSCTKCYIPFERANLGDQNDMTVMLQSYTL